MMPDTLTFFKELAPVGGLIVFALGVYRYWRAEAWKRTEYVAKLYKDFSNDADCKQALWIFSGDKRQLYRKDGDKLVGYDFDYDVLKRALDDAIALKTAPDAGKQLSADQLHICDTLDRTFIYLEQFDRAIERHLVSQSDVFPYFGYWIDLLNGDPSVISRADARRPRNTGARTPLPLHRASHLRWKMLCNIVTQRTQGLGCVGPHRNIT